MSLYSPNVSVLSSGRDALSQHHRTLWHRKGVYCWKVGSLQCNSSCLVFVSGSFPCSDKAGGHGWFSCAKQSSILVLTNLCSNEQLAAEIAVSLHLLTLLFCLRVCLSEVTTLE